MKTLNQAIKEATRKANKVHGFVIDNRELCILFVKVESNYSDEYSDEYITKAEIRYKLSADEKAERALEDEKREKRAKEISKGLSFLNF